MLPVGTGIEMDLGASDDVRPVGEEGCQDDLPGVTGDERGMLDVNHESLHASIR